MSRPLVVALVVPLHLLLGCGLEPLALEPGGDGGAAGTGGSGGSGGPTECAPGQIAGPDGACLAVGIQGCAERFIEADGLCHPRMDHCPAGTIPQFEEGCVPVGIQGCVDSFVEADGLCHPRMAKCPTDHFAAPLLGCVPIDGPEGCGTGTWGTIADGPDTLWVDPTYAGGDGVGSQAQPFTTIAEALAAVPAGGRVALAAGSYDEPLHLTQPVEIAGRCASLVTITGTQPTPYSLYALGPQLSDAIVLVEATDGVTLRNLSLSGAGYGLIAVSASATLQGVHIHEATGCGVFVREGADVTVERCLIEHTRPDPAEPVRGGVGIMAWKTGHLTVRDSALYRNRFAGLWVHTGSLVAEGVLVEHMMPDLFSGTQGKGLFVEDPAQADVASSALVNCCGQAIHVETGELALRDSMLEQTRGCSGDPGGGSGVSVTAAGWARLSRSAILDHSSAGIVGTDATLEAHGNLVRGNGEAGLIALGGQVALIGNAAVDNEWLGMGCVETDPGALVQRNLLQHNGTPEHEPYLDTGDGLGIHFTRDAWVQSNAAIDNFGNGIWIQESSARLEHNLVEANRATNLFARPGVGLMISGTDGLAEVAGLAALGNTTRGFWQYGAEQVALRRALIAHTQPRPSDGELGCGAVIEGAGTAEVEDVVVVDNQLAALLVHSSTLTLTSSRLGDTRAGSFTGLACPTMPCEWNKATVHSGIADGLIAAASTIELAGLEVTGCSRAGVLVHGSDGQLADVTSVDNGFGLVLQGFPQPEVLQDSCRFDPNDVQDVLTDSELAIPDGASELPEDPQ